MESVHQIYKNTELDPREISIPTISSSTEKNDQKKNNEGTIINYFAVSLTNALHLVQQELLESGYILHHRLTITV